MEKENKLDLLINNAGIMCTNINHRTKQGFERTFGVNVIGHFLFTIHLIPLLKNANSARIVNLSSLTHAKGRIDFNTLEYWRLLVNEGNSTITDFPLYTCASKQASLESVYADSKLAIILWTNELAERLKPFGINCNSMCPGIVATNILDDFNFFIRVFGPPVMKVMAVLGIGTTAEVSAKTVVLLGQGPEVCCFICLS